MSEYLLFGRFCVWRRRWQVRKRDHLAAIVSGYAQEEAMPGFPFWHALFVHRAGRRRKFVFGMYSNDRIVPGMEIFAQRVGKLVDIPYEGYREPVSKCLWAPR